jgi:dTMP kinase
MTGGESDTPGQPAGEDAPPRVPGRLIVLEGLDGAGTTTQARRLAEHLRTRGIAAHLTREPSDGPVGRLIREMLTGRHALASEPISQSTFGLLFAADRLDHLQREVDPQIAAGVTVISDRWYHSSLAYQGTGADRDWITALNARARRPDLTLFLEVRPEIAAQRRVAAGRVQELFDDLQMQQDVEVGYRATIAELTAHGERIEVIDGELPLDAVFQQILQLVGEPADR